jgi:hypothetical protein
MRQRVIRSLDKYKGHGTWDIPTRDIEEGWDVRCPMSLVFVQ